MAEQTGKSAWSGSGDALETTDERGERRTRRSQDRAEALQLQLDYVREQLGLKAIVLCDDLGEVIVSAGTSRAVSSLAGQAPWLAATPAGARETALAYLWEVFPGLDAHDFALHEVPGGGEAAPLLLTGIGRAEQLDVWVARAAAGVRRIMDTLPAN